MKDNGLLDSLLDVAKHVAPMIVPGAGAAIALGEKVVETIDKAKGMFGGEIPVPLGKERDALEAKVKAHVADTAARLRGDS